MANRKPSKTENVVLTPTTSDVFQGYEHGLFSAVHAASLLQISRSTFFRWHQRWRQAGELPRHGNGLRSPHNKIPDKVRDRVIELYRLKYYGFQATLLQEYLAKYEGIVVSVEWLRRLIVELTPKETSTSRRRDAHRLRRRRSCRGELVQIDGSPHRWFEGDDHPYTLIAFIDDATGEILGARFFRSETTAGYLCVLKGLIIRYGLPMALYSDRHSIFTVTSKDARHAAEESQTQFQRACEALGIELIHAHSPEAKGRVERLFRTLQGRWPKEFRIQGIRNMAEANERIEELISAHNSQFAIPPASDKDSLIPLGSDDLEDLSFIFAKWMPRTISRNLTVSNGPQLLQIVGVSDAGMRQAMKNTLVQVVEYEDGKVELYWHDEVRWREERRREGQAPAKHYVRLSYRVHERTKRPSSGSYEELPLETAKTIDARMDEIARRRDSPWREQMGVWARKAIEAREERERRQEEAKAIDARIAEAKELQKPKG